MSWRAAFLVPGAVSLATGIALAWCARGGRLRDDRAASADEPGGHSRAALVRAFVALMVCLALAGLIYHGTQTALPKLFELRHEGLVTTSALGVGVLVAVVYTAAGVMQVIGGHLADRYPLKPVYLGAVLVQAPLLWLAASAGGALLLVVCVLMVMAAVAALPAESMLLARYTPARRHGLAFGIKFVIAFGAAPLAVQLVAFITGSGRALGELFALLALFAACMFLAASALPPVRREGAAIEAGGGG